MISIIIPVYNVEAYLDACLRSIKAQTETGYEVLLVDDGSTDGSGEICDRWAAADYRFRVVHQANQGVSMARNNGLAQSKGNYILFLDPDDDVEIDMLEAMRRAFGEENGKRIDMVCCRYCRILHGETLHFYMKEQMMTQKEALRALLENLAFFNAVWNKMFRREVLLDEDGSFLPFPRNITVGEDSAWLCRALLRCGNVRCIDRELYHWYYRKNSATSQKMTAQYLTKIDAQKMIMETLKDYDKELYHLAHRRFLGNQRNCMAEAYAQGAEEFQEELLVRTKEAVRDFRPENIHDILFLLKYHISCVLAPRGVWKRK